MKPDLNQETAQTTLITEWLNRVARGEREEMATMAPEVLHGLLTVARSLSRRHPGAAMETRVLVNEFFLRFLKGQGYNFENRQRFFAFAAQVMRHTILDEIRKRPQAPITIEGLQIEIANPFPEHDLLEINDALTRLESVDREKYEIACCRMFLGLKNEEIADQLNLSIRSVERKWRAAKLWLISLLYAERGAAAGAM